MHRTFGILLILGSIGFFSCESESRRSSEGPPPANLEAELPGTWEIINIRVDIPSAGGQDTSIVFEIQESEWERVYNVQPKRTYFNLDDTYREEFRSIRDSLISQNSGTWMIEGDSLRMIEADTSYHYQVRVESGLAEFRGLLDWDGDGAKDDDYYARYRRISRSTSN